MKNILALSVFVILSLSCDRPEPVLEISNHLWPEGTAISVICDGGVIASSSLFGDHVRIIVPRRGSVTVRAASPTVITSLSPELIMEGGVVSYQLPIPVMRRRIGTAILGFGFTGPDAVPLCRTLAENSAASVTSLSLAPGEKTALAAVISSAHANAVEVILRADCGNASSRKAAIKSALACVDEAERSGADGVLFLPGDGFWRSGKFTTEIRTLAASAHSRGISLTVALTPEMMRVVHPVVFFDQVPAPECPDELLLLCYGTAPNDESPSVISLQQVEDALLEIMKEKIPLGRVSIEVRLSALACRTAEKNRPPVALSPGELKRVLAEAGEGSAIRMGDGSLLLGYKGVDYFYEDMKGIARKIRFLRSGEFARMRGVYILHDGLGVRPDEAGIRELADVLGGK